MEGPLPGNIDFINCTFDGDGSIQIDALNRGTGRKLRKIAKEIHDIGFWGCTFVGNTKISSDLKCDYTVSEQWTEQDLFTVKNRRSPVIEAAVIAPTEKDFAHTVTYDWTWHTMPTTGAVRRLVSRVSDADVRAAQTKLMDILSNYQGYKKCTLILVFDAYKVEGHQEEVLTYHNIHVVYTKEAETADQYIEKTVHKIGRQHQVTVATSDGLEQIIIMGQGANRISARGLKEEIEETRKQLRQEWHQRRQSSHTYLFDHADEETAKLMEEVRLGKKKL